MFFDKENYENAGVSLDTNVNSFPTKPVGEGSGTIATVICEKFQGAVWVGFGCVALNCTTSREFHLVNPSSSTVNITVDKCPEKKGFSITFGTDHATSVSVGPSETLSGQVHWTPSDNMSIREVGVLLMDNKHRLQLTLHGIAGKGTVSEFINHLISYLILSSLLMHKLSPIIIMYSLKFKLEK